MRDETAGWGNYRVHVSVIRIEMIIVYPTYRKPFDLISQRAKKEEWRALADDLRTLPIGQFMADLPTWSDLPMV